MQFYKWWFSVHWKKKLSEGPNPILGCTSALLHFISAGNWCRYFSLWIFANTLPSVFLNAILYFSRGLKIMLFLWAANITQGVEEKAFWRIIKGDKCSSVLISCKARLSRSQGSTCRKVFSLEDLVDREVFQPSGWSSFLWGRHDLLSGIAENFLSASIPTRLALWLHSYVRALSLCYIWRDMCVFNNF